MNARAESRRGGRARLLPGVLLLAAAVLAAALRLPYLNLRPVHGDEAVHMYKCNELWMTGEYHYDPAEYHGPTLYYATLPVLALTGVRDWRDAQAATFRIAPVLFGLGLVLLSGAFISGLGRSAALWAALFTAVSPAMTFYSRDYIQEVLLVFFVTVVIVAGRHYCATNRLGWAVLTGAGLGLMHATKETCVLAWAALGGALLVVTYWTQPPRVRWPAVRSRLRAGPVVAGLLTAIFVSVACFSVFFREWRGPVDSVLAFGSYLHRAGGAGHEHPWYYYFQILLTGSGLQRPLFTEALIVALGLAGGILGVLRRGVSAERVPFLRFLALYTLFLATALSAIPYKTPWTLLSFHHGLVLLAGVGAAALVHGLRRLPIKVAAVAALLGGAAQLGWQSWQSDVRLYTHPRNPYVYAQPLHGVEECARYVAQLGAAATADQPIVVKVITENPWPLPWYLRELPQVGYWEAVPAEPDADVVVVAADLVDEVRVRLHHTYAAPEYFALRPNVRIAVLARADLRQRFEEQQQPQATRAAAAPGTRP